MSRLVLLTLICAWSSAAIAEEPYLAIVQAYADALIDHGTDVYGTTKSGMLLSIMDRKTLRPPLDVPQPPHGVRNSDRVTRVGSNVNLDQNLYRVLYALSEVTGDPRYAAAADKALTDFLRLTPSPVTGLFAWGEHLCWDLQKDAWGSSDGSCTHEPKRTTVLFERMASINPEAMIGYAHGLWEHQIGDQETGNFSRHTRYDRHSPRLDFDFPKEGGYFIHDWARAYGLAQDPVFLTAIAKLVERYQGKMDANRWGYLDYCVTYPFAATSASTSLAIEVTQAAAELPAGQLKQRMLALATGIDRGVLGLPHQIAKEGFVEFVSTKDGSLYPHKEHGGYAFTWGMKYGCKTNAMIGVLFCSRAQQLPEGETRTAYRQLSIAAADRYLTTDPDLAERPWPVELGIVCMLEIAAYELTGDQRYLERARHFADVGVQAYWDSTSPLPKADPVTAHYENITRADTLVYALLKLHVIDQGLQVAMPISDIDR